MVKLIDLLKEIGDASARPYDWKRTVDEEDYKEYMFQTKEGLYYKVEIQVLEGDEERDSAFVQFGIVEPDEDNMGFTDFDGVPTRGDLFNIMATIVEVLKDLIKNNPNIKYLQFETDKRSHITNKGKKVVSNARFDLYTKYIQKHLPNAEVTTDSKGGYEMTSIKLKELNVPKPEDAYKFISTSKAPHQSGFYYTYTFKNNKGQELDVTNNVVDTEDQGKLIYVAFGIAGIEPDSYQDDIRKYGVKTGSGDMLKVMATVVEAIKRTMKQEGGEDKISMILFSPSDEKRDRIYNYYIQTLFSRFRKSKNQFGMFTAYVNQDFKK